MARVSKKPCTVPSSPWRPCRIGRTTSTEPSSSTRPSAWRTRSARSPPPSGHRMRVPLSTTSGRLSASSANLSGSSSSRTKTPSRVIPTGLTRYRSRLIARRTPPAVAELIECSLERPPKSTATAGLSILRPLALGLVVVGSQVRRDLARVHGSVEHALDLLDDRHLDAGFLRQLQHRGDRGQPLRRLVHLLHDILKAVALTEQAPRRVVPAERGLARRDEVAEAREALQRLGCSALRDREVRHLDQPARDDRRLRVLAVADAVDDADGDRDQVLEDPAELGADDISVHEGAEVVVA